MGGVSVREERVGEETVGVVVDRCRATVWMMQRERTEALLVLKKGWGWWGGGELQ